MLLFWVVLFILLYAGLVFIVTRALSLNDGKFQDSVREKHHALSSPGVSYGPDGDFYVRGRKASLSTSYEDDDEYVEDTPYDDDEDDDDEDVGYDYDDDGYDDDYDDDGYDVDDVLIPTRRSRYIRRKTI